MADDPSVIAGTFKSRRLLRESETAMEDLLTAFDVMAKRIRDGEDDMTPAEISKTRTALGHVRSQLVDEVNKHEQRVFHAKGLVADAPLNFDNLRAEIRSHLDRIRAAQDSS